MSDEQSQALSHADYWNARYATSDGENPTHEWFKSFEALGPFFASRLFGVYDTNAKILHLGSGDSTIPRGLARHGFNNQLCIDFSSVVVKLMSDRDGPEIEWQQADVRNMTTIPDKSIDVAFDKGTLDAMIYGSPWDPPEAVKHNTGQYMDEVCDLHVIVVDDP